MAFGHPGCEIWRPMCCIRSMGRPRHSYVGSASALSDEHWSKNGCELSEHHQCQLAVWYRVGWQAHICRACTCVCFMKVTPVCPDLEWVFVLIVSSTVVNIIPVQVLDLHTVTANKLMSPSHLWLLHYTNPRPWSPIETPTHSQAAFNYTLRHSPSCSFPCIPF